MTHNIFKLAYKEYLNTAFATGQGSPVDFETFKKKQVSYYTEYTNSVQSAGAIMSIGQWLAERWCLGLKQEHEVTEEELEKKAKDFATAITSTDWSDTTETINMPDLLQKQVYQEYLTLCKNGEVEPMAFEQWAEWDRDVYQKHVREAASPLTPDTFQRMQQANLTEGKGMNQLRDMYQGIVEENESLVVDLAVADQNIDALAKERDTYRSMADELNTKVGELRVRNEELIQFLEQAILAKAQAEAETTRIGRLNGELRTQLEAKDKEVADLVHSNNVISTSLQCAKELTSELLEDNKWLKTENANLSQENEELFERGESVTTPLPTPANYHKYPHYFRPTPHTTHIDVNWFLKAFSVPCCEGHAIKKLAVAGQRGVKDRLQDLEEARNSINRAIELEQTK